MSALMLADSTLRARFNAIFDAAASAVVGREALILPMKLALLTKNHVLLIGKPGVAKSKFVRSILESFKDCETFRIQCTKRMSEEYLVGPLDMKLFRNAGEYRHLVDGSMVTAELAFLDEFLDLPDQSLRALLEILNERRFTRGKQREVCKLHTAFAATNFSPTNEQVEAVQDRFLFRANVAPLADSDDIEKMLNAVSVDAAPVRKMPFKWLQAMRRRAASVTVDPVLFTAFAKFAQVAKGTLNVTDRRIVWSLEAVKAYAYLSGRDYVLPNDFLVTEHTFMTAGEDKQAKDFASAVSLGWVPHAISDNAYETCYAMEGALRSLSIDVALWQRKESTVDIAALKTELTDFICALRNDPNLNSGGIASKTAALTKEAARYIRVIDNPESQKAEA